MDFHNSLFPCVLLLDLCLLAAASAPFAWWAKVSEDVTSKILKLPLSERTPKRAVSMCMQNDTKLSCAWITHSDTSAATVLKVSCYDDERSSCRPMFYIESALYDDAKSCSDCEACNNHSCPNRTFPGGCKVTCWCSCYAESGVSSNHLLNTKYKYDKDNLFKCSQSCDSMSHCKYSKRDETDCFAIIGDSGLLSTIIYGIIGVVSFIAGVGFLVYFCYRRRTRVNRPPPSLPGVTYTAVTSAQNPVTYPMTQNSGSYPAQNPGSYPVQNPGSYPVQNPGSYPVQNPGSYPVQNVHSYGDYPAQNVQNPVQNIGNPVDISSAPPPAYEATVGQHEFKA